MSTHAFIGVVENTGTLKYVYNHSDGYPVLSWENVVGTLQHPQSWQQRL